MTAEQNVFFNRLTLQEKQSKIAQLSKSTENKFTLWKKGSQNKVSISPVNFIRSKSELQIAGRIPDDLFDSEILYTFELNGLHFFGSAKLFSVAKQRIFLDCTEDLFKSERRSNFRLLTYPHHEVYIHIPVPEEEKENSNIVSLMTKTSQTGLFQNFLEIVGDEVEEQEKIEGSIKFRVIDISVTGLAFQFGDIESQLFPEDEIELGPIVLDFNDERIPLPGGKLLYRVNYLPPNRKTKSYKAGVAFTNIDTNLDEILSNKINKALRSAESEFEDFLK